MTVISQKELPMWKTMQIDIQSLCNRDCIWCPRYDDKSGIRKDIAGKPVKKIMPTENVLSIIEQVSKLGFQGEITFHRLSEPFLDPRYIEFAKYANKHNLKVIEFTNGDILKKKPELCSELDGLLKRIYIGLYDFNSYKELKSEKQYWRKQFKKTKVIFSVPHIHTQIRQGSMIYSQRSKNEKILNSPCYRAFKEGLAIRYDGEVSLCCDDDACNFNLGNAFKQPIEEIWWSKRRKEIYETLSKPMGRHKYPLCKKCYRPPSVFDVKMIISYLVKPLLLRIGLWKPSKR